MTKACPFCAEDINENAIKCKHCGEFLDNNSLKAPSQTVSMYEDEYLGKRAQDVFKEKEVPSSMKFLALIFLLVGSYFLIKSDVSVYQYFICLFFYLVVLAHYNKSLSKENRNNIILFNEEQKQKDYEHALDQGIMLKKRIPKESSQTSNFLVKKTSLTKNVVSILFLIFASLFIYSLLYKPYASKNIFAQEKISLCKINDKSFTGNINQCNKELNRKHSDLVTLYLEINKRSDGNQKNYYCDDFNANSMRPKRIEYCIKIINDNTNKWIDFQNKEIAREKEYQQKLKEIDQKYNIQKNANTSSTSNSPSGWQILGGVLGVLGAVDAYKNPESYATPSVKKIDPPEPPKELHCSGRVGGGPTYTPGHGWQKGRPVTIGMNCK